MYSTPETTNTMNLLSTAYYISIGLTVVVATPLVRLSSSVSLRISA